LTNIKITSESSGGKSSNFEDAKSQPIISIEKTAPRVETEKKQYNNALRKKLRRKYIKMESKMNSDRSELVEPGNEMLLHKIRKSNALFDTVSHPREAVLGTFFKFCFLTTSIFLSNRRTV
jgi:hypothetical protein